MSELTDYIDARLRDAFRKKWEEEIDMIIHELWWGVSCGPTMSMVNPPVLRGVTHLAGMIPL